MRLNVSTCFDIVNEKYDNYKFYILLLLMWGSKFERCMCIVQCKLFLSYNNGKK